jgi:hypothetical protein
VPRPGPWCSAREVPRPGDVARPVDLVPRLGARVLGWRAGIEQVETGERLVPLGLPCPHQVREAIAVGEELHARAKDQARTG